MFDIIIKLQNQLKSSMNEVATFYCRLSFYESELIKEALRKAERKNVIVVHSCAVTNEAERQVKQKIRKINKVAKRVARLEAENKEILITKSCR